MRVHDSRWFLCCVLDYFLSIYVYDVEFSLLITCLLLSVVVFSCPWSKLFNGLLFGLGHIVIKYCMLLVHLYTYDL